MILVAGATGFVGRALVEVLRSGRRPWVELSSSAPDPENAGEVSAIVHLAGVPPGVRPSRADREVAEMRRLIALAKQRQDGRFERFVFLSATSASSRTSHPWLRAKGEAEALLRESGLPFVILRASLVVGSESRVLNSLMQVVRGQAGTDLKLRLPLLSSGRVLPISAGDVAIALASALDHHLMVGRTIDVGVAPAVSLAELLELVAGRLGREVRRTRVPFAGYPLAQALAAVPVAPLDDADSFVRLFSVLEPPDLAPFERLLPMTRTTLVDELRRCPWGAPPVRPGDLLPTIAPEAAPGLPLFIPGERLREARDPASPRPAWLGRTDPFGNVERSERSPNANASDDAAH